MIIVANAGSYGICQCDDIQALNNLSVRFKMWVHLEGIYISTLVLYSVPTAIQVIKKYFFLIGTKWNKVSLNKPSTLEYYSNYFVPAPFPFQTIKSFSQKLQDRNQG